MLKPEQIPPDAMYAAWKCMNAGMTLNEAIAAAINAWPGVRVKAVLLADTVLLPLPQEPRDARHC